MLTVAFSFYQAAIGPYPFTDLPWLPLANFVGLAPFFIVMFGARLQGQGFDVSLSVKGDDITITDPDGSRTSSGKGCKLSGGALVPGARHTSREATLVIPDWNRITWCRFSGS